MMIFAFLLFSLQCFVTYALARFTVQLYQGKVQLEKLPRAFRSLPVLKVLFAVVLAGLVINTSTYAWVFFFHGHY